VGVSSENGGKINIDWGWGQGIKRDYRQNLEKIIVFNVQGGNPNGGGEKVNRVSVTPHKKCERKKPKSRAEKMLGDSIN